MVGLFLATAGRILILDSVGPIPRDAVGVPKAGATEDVERATDGDIDVSMAEIIGALQVIEACGASGIGGRNPIP